jgi:hypothetical protein
MVSIRRVRFAVAVLVREGGMSVTKLLFSGFLVASGLILGAFTLHGAFAPEWEVQASAPSRSYGRPQPVEPLPEPDRGVVADVPDNWAPRLIKAPDHRPPAALDPKAAEAKKKLAEKKKKKQEEPQTVFSWLAGLLNKTP